MENTTNPTVDPFDVSTSDVNTSFPILPPANYEFVVGEVKKVRTQDQNESDPENMLQIELKTTSEIRSTLGEAIQPGFSLRTNLVFVPKGRLTTDQIKKSVAALAQSAHVVGTVREIINNPTMLSGKTVRAKVVVQAETAEYGERNNVKYFLVD